MCEFAQVCVKPFLRKKFIATRPIPNLTPILDPWSVRYLDPNLRVASGSTTSRPRLRSGR